MFFSYTKSDFDCEYIMVNPLIFKLVYTRHNVSSDVIVGAFGVVDFEVKRGVERLYLTEKKALYFEAFLIVENEK